MGRSSNQADFYGPKILIPVASTFTGDIQVTTPCSPQLSIVSACNKLTTAIYCWQLYLESSITSSWLSPTSTVYM